MRLSPPTPFANDPENFTAAHPRSYIFDARHDHICPVSDQLQREVPIYIPRDDEIAPCSGGNWFPFRKRIFELIRIRDVIPFAPGLHCAVAGRSDKSSVVITHWSHRHRASVYLPGRCHTACKVSCEIRLELCPCPLELMKSKNMI